MKNLLIICITFFTINLIFANNGMQTQHPDPTYKQVKIKRGTMITLQLMDNVNSMNVETDNTIEMMVLVGVEKDGQALIETGTYAEGKISRARRAGVYGRSAVIELEGTSIKTSDGQRVSINSVKTVKRGKSRKVFAVGASIAIPAIGVTMGAPVFLPFAAIGLLIRGREVEIEKGTLVRAKLKYDILVRVPNN